MAEPDRVALRDASNRLAVFLSWQRVTRGDRVAIYLAHGLEMLISVLAIRKPGAVPLPLFTLFGAEVLACRITDSDAKLVLTEPQNDAGLTDVMRDPGLISAYFEAGAGGVLYKTYISGA